MAYSLGKSPIINDPKILENPRLVKIDHPVYMWNESLFENGVVLIEIVDPGEILVLLSYNVNILDENNSCDCYVFSQKGKFGWALIDICGITYLDGDNNDIST